MDTFGKCVCVCVCVCVYQFSVLDLMEELLALVMMLKDC